MTDKRKDDNLIEGAAAEQILNFLIADGRIDLGDVQSDMRQARRDLVLENHPYAIYKGKDGRYRTYVKDYSKKNNRRLIAKQTMEDLLEALCDDYYGVDRSTAKNKEAYTMASLFEEWLEYKSLHVAQTTVDRTRRDWTRYYAGEKITRKPIVTLTKLELDVWVHEMIRKFEMNKHRFANFRSILRQELDYAVDLGIISHNPFNDVKVNARRVLAPEHKKEDHTQVFTKEELAGLRELAWEDFHKKEHPVHQLAPLAVMFMFVTGVRVGEVCAIRYEDITGNTLTVRRMVEYPSGKVIDHTKGAFGDRKIPLIPQAMELIEAARQRQRECGVSDTGYLFSMRDTPILYTSVTKAFYAYCDRLGIDAKSSHKARKTFISSLLDEDVNLNTVRQIAGHVDERTTLNNYYFDRSSDEEKIAKMTKALA